MTSTSFPSSHSLSLCSSSIVSKADSSLEKILMYLSTLFIKGSFKALLLIMAGNQALQLLYLNTFLFSSFQNILYFLSLTFLSFNLKEPMNISNVDCSLLIYILHLIKSLHSIMLYDSLMIVSLIHCFFLSIMIYVSKHLINVYIFNLSFLFSFILLHLNIY